MYFCVVMDVLLQLPMSSLPLVRFPTALIEGTSFTQLIILSQGKGLTSTSLSVIPVYHLVFMLFLFVFVKTNHVYSYLPTYTSFYQHF